MVDTRRSLAALQTLLADNTAGEISPQDIRDALVSMYPSIANESHERFVSMDGNDNHDGMSWSSAKATIEDAVDSLPEEGAGGTLRRAGDVRIGPGDWTTSAEIECSENIRFWGSGCPLGLADATTTGTVIKLGHNGHCFAPRATFTDYAHFVQFHNLGISGEGITGAYDLIRLHRPGGGAGMYNVHLRSAPRTGLRLIDNCVSFYSYNLFGLKCPTHFIHMNFATGNNLGSASFFGTQLDDCGQYPIQIDNDTNGNKFIAFYGLESESRNAGEHEGVICHNPIGGTNGAKIMLHGAECWANGTERETVMKELAGSGAAAWWNWSMVSGANYNYVFDSAKTSIRHDYLPFALPMTGQVGITDTYEFRFGTIAVATGSGAPSNTDNRPIGSVWFRNNGEIWTKTGASTWTQAIIT